MDGLSTPLDALIRSTRGPIARRAYGVVGDRMPEGREPLR
jgi:hypothetical protein